MVWRLRSSDPGSRWCVPVSLKTWEPGTPVVRVPAFVRVWRQETNAPAQRQSGGEREFSLPLPFCFIQAFTKACEANLRWGGRLPYSAYRFKHESHADDSPSQTRQRVGPTTCAAIAQSSWRVKLAHPAGPSCIVLPLNCGKRPYMRLNVGLATWLWLSEVLGWHSPECGGGWPSALAMDRPVFPYSFCC